MGSKLKLGFVGFGRQVKRHHFPYLERRMSAKGDIEVAWISGYLSEHSEEVERYLCEHACAAIHRPEEHWRKLLSECPVEGVVISLPNALHLPAAKEAMAKAVNVAIEKPPTNTAGDCQALVETAKRLGLVLVTMSQRRYEDVYRTARSFVDKGQVGEILHINYLIAHKYFYNQWTHSKHMSGGGALIASGYHGIDTMLWLLRGAIPTLHPISVSARCIQEYADSPDPERAAFAGRIPDTDRIEVVANVRIMLDNGGMFNATASYEGPGESLDENIKIYGKEGTIRIVRDRFARTDNTAAQLSYQSRDGQVEQIDTAKWIGKEWSPVEDFVDAIQDKKHGRSWSVESPCSDSIDTLRVIEAAYESAHSDGREVPL